VGSADVVMRPRLAALKKRFALSFWASLERG